MWCARFRSVCSLVIFGDVGLVHLRPDRKNTIFTSDHNWPKMVQNCNIYFRSMRKTSLIYLGFNHVKKSSRLKFIAHENDLFWAHHFLPTLIQQLAIFSANKFVAERPTPSKKHPIMWSSCDFFPEEIKFRGIKFYCVDF